ncbi:unnamed protein product [Tuber aestivum]|uniref:Uncharacterized protein n=1 Tax=Tuber aestivum TaxID=59557 RepID=A0A292PPJ0_9PEZI|nr:unnamed protein product [Tuber aestivum]
MASVQHTTSPGQPQALHQTNGHPPQSIQQQQSKPTAFQQLTQVNEAVWLQIGVVTELMGDLDRAMGAYENALRQNPYSIPAMNSISCILRTKEQFAKAVEYLQSILNLDATNGDIWGSLGHCYLMMDELQKAYSAYQQALYHLRDPKEPKLWYGIGILYDRYGSLEHAEEAFSQVMRMEPNFEKANEIYFRLGIIYKQQEKYRQSLECFRYIVTDPPRPLTEEDIWFQIGHVYEQQKDYPSAKDAYMRVLDSDPNHAKVLQQLGWLHHQQSNNFSSQELAIEYLEKSGFHLGSAIDWMELTGVIADNSDAQSWYLLGRCYMSQQKYPKAYEAYQQAVYRDGRNPTFWCSIGVLYYQINQYRDALDAYSRAIRLNPYISEVWYDLGTLTNDALDAYQRAAELDPTNQHIKARLSLLRNGQSSGVQHQASAPPPQDVHPQAYQAAGVGGPPGPQWGSQAPQVPPPAPSGPPPTLPQIPQPPNPSSYRPADVPPQPPQPPRHMAHSPDDIRRPVEDSRHTQLRRGLSPSPKFSSHSPHTSYPPPPLQGPPPPQSQQQPQQQQQQPPPNRILNPHHSSHILPPASNNPGGISLPPYGGRAASPPPPDVKPIVDDRLPSPGTYSRHPQHPHHPSSQGGIAGGAPPPASATMAAEAAARERDEKIHHNKRAREWEEDEGQGIGKKPASEETRARMDDMRHHRPSPPVRVSSPHRPERRRSSSERPREDYHGPPAPLHTPNVPPPLGHQQLPPINDGPRMPEPPPRIAEAHRMSEAPRDDRKEIIEPAARKVELDEDYDNEEMGDDRGAGGNPGVQVKENNSPVGNGTNGISGGGPPGGD